MLHDLVHPPLYAQLMLMMIHLSKRIEGSIKEMHTLDDHREQGDSVLSIAVDGTFLYAGRADGEVNLWDLETRQLIRNIKTKTDDVLALTVGGGFIFCAGLSGVIEVSLANSHFMMMTRR